jgi:hypothetical protein
MPQVQCSNCGGYRQLARSEHQNCRRQSRAPEQDHVKSAIMRVLLDRAQQTNTRTFTALAEV